MQQHPWSLMLSHGSLEVYRHDHNSLDTSGSHTRDIAYVVINGTGTLVRDGFDFPFGTGDLLFVPANLPRHFSGVSADFEAYALLYGAEGGEQVGQHAEVPAQSSGY